MGFLLCVPFGEQGFTTCDLFLGGCIDAFKLNEFGADCFQPSASVSIWGSITEDPFPQLPANRITVDEEPTGVPCGRVRVG